ncbi:MAG TPA: hypothetical protein VFR86_08100 [Burkholderiaceae bacterium]|nr:hypothetical protein [Burkholderiaceae bacterium]
MGQHNLGVPFHTQTTGRETQMRGDTHTHDASIAVEPGRNVV